MENTEKQKGYDFEIVGLGILQNLGIYSLKHKSFDRVPVGGTCIRSSAVRPSLFRSRILPICQRIGLLPSSMIRYNPGLDLGLGLG